MSEETFREAADRTVSPSRSPLARVMREPLTYFVGLAILLFAFAELAERVGADVVEIDRRDVEARILQMERAQGSALTDDERRRAELGYIDEVILAREANLRGLDDDVRIRAILSQKMLHLISMDLPQPSDAELRAFFEENEAGYATPASVTVDQLLAPRGGGNTELAPPPSTGDIEALAAEDGFEHTVLNGVTLNELSIAFGAETANLIFGAEGDRWVGPHQTEGGALWFRVTGRVGAGPAPPFESLIGQVRFDWMTKYEEPYLQSRVEALRERYRVLLVDDAEGR